MSTEKMEIQFEVRVVQVTKKTDKDGKVTVDRTDLVDSTAGAAESAALLTSVAERLPRRQKAAGWVSALGALNKSIEEQKIKAREEGKPDPFTEMRDLLFGTNTRVSRSAPPRSPRI